MDPVLLLILTVSLGVLMAAGFGTWVVVSWRAGGFPYARAKLALTGAALALFVPVSGWITGLLSGWGTEVVMPDYRASVAQVFSWVLAAALVLICLPAPRQVWELFKLNLLSRVLHWPRRRAQ